MLCINHSVPSIDIQANGAEELCRILNGFFTILVGIVHKFGGDIVKVQGPLTIFVFCSDASRHLIKFSIEMKYSHGETVLLIPSFSSLAASSHHCSLLAMPCPLCGCWTTSPAHRATLLRQRYGPLAVRAKSTRCVLPSAPSINERMAITQRMVKREQSSQHD